MSNVVNRIELPPLLEAETGERSSVVGERLDLVGHVKVRLAVTLGTAELTIDKLFSLAANDVVSLDRDLEAPVDVRLNDKVIARGTLVAVGDNSACASPRSRARHERRELVRAGRWDGAGGIREQLSFAAESVPLTQGDDVVTAAVCSW